MMLVPRIMGDELKEISGIKLKVYVTDGEETGSKSMTRCALALPRHFSGFLLC